VSVDGTGGCGDGLWGEVPHEPGTIYVDLASVSQEEDGSQLNPYHSLVQALDSAPEGGRIVVAAGTYEEPLLITKSITIVGRCPSKVKLAGTMYTGNDLPVSVYILAAGVHLQGLQIGGGGVGVMAYNAPDTTLDSVWIRGAQICGAWLFGASGELHIRDSVIENTLPDDLDGTYGRGLCVQDAAKAVLERCSLIENRESAIDAWGTDTQLFVSDSLVEDTLPRDTDLMHGRGISIYSGAEATITSSAVISNFEIGIACSNSDSKLFAENNLIEDTKSQLSDLMSGGSLQVEDGATATLAANALVGNRNWGIMMSTEATGSISSNLILETLPRDFDGMFGIGIAIEEGSDVSIDGNAVISSCHSGITLTAGSGNPAYVVHQNLIEGTYADELLGTEVGGHGVELSYGAQVLFSENAAFDNDAEGLRIDGYSTDVTAFDNHFEGNLSGGIGLGNGALGLLSGNSVVGNYHNGIFLDDAHSETVVQENLISNTMITGEESDVMSGIGVGWNGVTLADNTIHSNPDQGIEAFLCEGLVIERNLVQGTFGGGAYEWGSGMMIGGVSAVVEGNAVVDNSGFGLLISGNDYFSTDIEIRGVLVEDTRPGAESNDYGAGIAAQYGSTVTIDASHIEQNLVAGVLLWEGEASITDTLITSILTGAFAKSDLEVSHAADGIMALSGSNTSVTGCVVTHTQRAGILFDNSSGTIGDNLVSKNEFGVVLQGDVIPELVGDNHIEDNEQQDLVTDDDLDVPDQLTPLPDDS